MLALVLVPAIAACGGEEETTTTAPSGTVTTAAPTDAAGIADAAVAAVTKSANIETPPTIKAGFLQGGSDTSFPPMEF
jgi:hypothetical protein